MENTNTSAIQPEANQPAGFESKAERQEMNKEKLGYFLLACAAITADQWLDSIGLLCGVLGFWLAKGDQEWN